jgi:hypothetical protein
MDSSSEIRNGISFSYDTPYYVPRHHTTVVGRATIWTLLLQEARAVSLWSCLSILVRVFLACLALLAGEIETMKNGSSSSSNRNNIDRLWFLPPYVVSSPSLQDWLFQASGVASLLLCLVPAKVALHQAPGFSFANPWCVVGSYLVDSIVSAIQWLMILLLRFLDGV